MVYGVFDPTDSTRLFTVGKNGEAILWDRRDPDHPHQIGAPFHFGFSLDSYYPPFTSVSADGRLLAIGNDAGRTMVWDVPSHTVLHDFDGWPGEFGPDGTTLPVSSDKVILWNARTGQQLGDPCLSRTPIPTP